MDDKILFLLFNKIDNDLYNLKEYINDYKKYIINIKLNEILGTIGDIEKLCNNFELDTRALRDKLKNG